MYIDYKYLQDQCIDTTEDKATDAIALAQAYIDKATGQFFEKKTMTMKVDSCGINLIMLPVFCSSITELSISGSVIDPEDYVLYNRYYPDDRDNPKVEFTYRPGRGSLNISIAGDFGYVEQDGTTPLQIQKICAKLAITELKSIADPEKNALINSGRIIEEDTDSHSYKLSELVTSGMYTGDPEIDTILEFYRRPLAGGLA